MIITKDKTLLFTSELCFYALCYGCFANYVDALYNIFLFFRNIVPFLKKYGVNPATGKVYLV